MSNTSPPHPSIPKSRIQSLSDLIFGLALTIGAVQLVGNSLPANNDELLADIGSFAFSFLILISIWNRYTTIMSYLPVDTTGLIRLNILLLFLVALEPYLFNVLTAQSLSSSPVGPEISSYYALDIGGMNLILAYFSHILTREGKNRIAEESIRSFKNGRNAIFLAGLIFVISAIPIFWTISIGEGLLPLRLAMWIASIPLIWLTRIMVRRKRKR
jgi:uncharacterized membrane protein